VLPQTSINGTSVDALVEQQAAVITALCQVERRMAAAMPHGRDYQYRPAEYPQARDAWIARMQAIAQLKQELVEHAVAIRRTEG
jgi:predicted GNAT superfamily acetyltransferase